MLGININKRKTLSSILGKELVHSDLYIRLSYQVRQNYELTIVSGDYIWFKEICLAVNWQGMDCDS